MQPDAFNRTVDALHADAEQSLAHLQIPPTPLPASPSAMAESCWRSACAPAGTTATLTFLDTHGTATTPMQISTNVAYRLTGSPGDEEIAEAARAHGAVSAVLCSPVIVNLSRVASADPAALAAHPGTDPTAHPGVITIAAYAAPRPVMPLVRLSLTGGGRITRITADPTGTPVPPLAARWLRLLLP